MVVAVLMCRIALGSSPYASPNASPVKHGESSKGGVGGKKAAMKRKKSAQSSATKRQPKEDDGYLADGSSAKQRKLGRPSNPRASSAKKRSRSDDSYTDMDSTPPADFPTQKRARLARLMNDVGERDADGGEHDYRPSSPEALSGGESTRESKFTRRASFRTPKPIRRDPTPSVDKESSPEINVFSDEEMLRMDPATTFSESGRPQRRSAINAHQSKFPL